MRFVLVHGGMHGAWCWDLLIPELHKLGHEGVAMDLPGHGVRRHEKSTLDGYRDAVIEVLEPGDVVVGHSMGCPVSTIAVDAFPDIAHIIYIAGPVPREGQPMSAATLTSINSGDEIRIVEGGAQNYLKFSPDGEIMYHTDEDSRELYYHDCDPEVADWAIAQLTPQQTGVLVEETISVPRFWELAPPRSFIRCEHDRVLPAEISALQIARLGVEPLNIPTSHSPFLSSPAQLAALFVRATSTQPTGPLLST
jgi:pimeloyl-ACP methyl ester carboxylesterase